MGCQDKCSKGWEEFGYHHDYLQVSLDKFTQEYLASVKTFWIGRIPEGFFQTVQYPWNTATSEMKSSSCAGCRGGWCEKGNFWPKIAWANPCSCPMCYGTFEGLCRAKWLGNVQSTRSSCKKLHGTDLKILPLPILTFYKNCFLVVQDLACFKMKCSLLNTHGENILKTYNLAGGEKFTSGLIIFLEIKYACISAFRWIMFFCPYFILFKSVGGFFYFLCCFTAG